MMNSMMNLTRTKRTVEVDVIVFNNNVEVLASTVYKFLDLAYDFIDTIGKDGNWTSNYFYFETKEEKELENVLLDLGVIRLSPAHREHNIKVGIVKYYDNYYYWLDDNYHKFHDEFYKTLDN